MGCLQALWLPFFGKFRMSLFLSVCLLSSAYYVCTAESTLQTARQAPKALWQHEALHLLHRRGLISATEFERFPIDEAARLF